MKKSFPSLCSLCVFHVQGLSEVEDLIGSEGDGVIEVAVYGGLRKIGQKKSFRVLLITTEVLLVVQKQLDGQLEIKKKVLNIRKK